MIKKPKRLENLLGYSLNELDCIINSIDQYYYEDIKIKKMVKSVSYTQVLPLLNVFKLKSKIIF